MIEVRGQGSEVRDPAGEKPPFAAGAWMTGTLLACKEAGYAFISLGEEQPQVFVRVTEVPARLWKRGALLRFRVFPPEKGRRSWVAREVESGALPTGEDLDAVAAEELARTATQQ